jgi:hypothetical protein
MSNTKRTKPGKTLDEKLAGAQRVEDRMMVYLPGPLRAEWSRVKEEFDQVKARQLSTDMLVPDPEERRLARRLQSLQEQMRDDSIEVTVRALRRQRTPVTPDDETTWKELVEKHPPRKGKDGKLLAEDAGAQVNMETFPEALIRVSIVDPVMTPEQWDTLLYEVVNDRQFDALFDKAWRLNRNDVDIPFSPVASKTLRSGTVSRRQSNSGSPADGSSDGNRPT